MLIFGLKVGGCNWVPKTYTIKQFCSHFGRGKKQKGTLFHHRGWVWAQLGCINGFFTNENLNELYVLKIEDNGL